MHATFAVPGNSRTILTHLFGRGLEDDRYVVERFDALANGEIRPRPAVAPAKKGRGKTKRTIASLRAVQRLRPARTEIIICTGQRRLKGRTNRPNGRQHLTTCTEPSENLLASTGASIDGVRTPS